MKMLEKLLEKKKGEKPISKEYKDSKMSVLKALHDEMSRMMGDDLKGLKKVTVASDDKEGLEEGLDKAKDLIASGELSPMESEQESEESSEEEKSDEECTPAELDEKIKKLQELKAKMMKV